MALNRQQAIQATSHYLSQWWPCCPVHLYTSGLIQGLRQANERRHYFVTTYLIGWVQAQNQHCIYIYICINRPHFVNTLRLRKNGRHFPDYIFKCIFLDENVWISIKISLKFVPKGPINNIPALVQMMACPRSCDKPLSQPMMVNLLMHICVTQPQWVN